jgi:hypothetical protein
MRAAAGFVDRDRISREIRVAKPAAPINEFGETGQRTAVGSIDIDPNLDLGPAIERQIDVLGDPMKGRRPFRPDPAGVVRLRPSIERDLDEGNGVGPKQIG